MRIHVFGGDKMRKMKASGIEWIGQIPDEWNIWPTKRFFRHTKIVAGKHVDLYERLALTMSGVIKRNKDDSEGLQPEKFDTYQVLRENELVFKLIDLANVKTSRVGLSTYTGIVSPAYIVLSNDNSDNRFYYYYFMFMYYNEIFNNLGDNGVRSSLNAQDLLNIPMIDVPLETQKHIADFLDDKCSKIDRYIEKQQQIIEKLKEYKQSVITESVTKGLNQDVPMKDSGIEWIGMIPEHWSLGKTGYITKKIGSGKTPKGGAEVYAQEGILFLRSQNIYDYGLEIEDPIFINEEIDNEMSNTRVYKNDILLNITGGSIGRSCIYPFESHANVNQHVCIIRVIDTIILPMYMNFFWISNAGQTSIDIYQSGANREGLNFEQISKTFLPVPSIEEQEVIIDFLNKKCKTINDSIKDATIIVDRLIEYKKSLIYEAVTGKLEV